ncbi:facilitated trehalose transporter Tret1-like [Chelonus insularis]|uniref:facilitated trehalose transporter Tret1-like n=1 Tax=Chelonus insularis TaxID=460826 RepID=UPI00158C5BCB|nr:facilitated trehalose transporter Tret1-like [Chelonus insularis]
MPDKGRYTSPEGSHIWEYWTTFVCSIQAFCIGCIIGWNSPTFAILLKPDSPVPIDHNDVSTIAAAGPLGHLIAPIIANLMIDTLGRKNSMFLGGLPLIVSWAMMCVSQNLWVLIIARIMAGLSLGVSFCVSPLYLGEIASTKLRGMIGSTYGIMANAGILFSFIIIPYLSMSVASGVFLSISVVVQVALYFILESPYFLMLVGRESEAEAVLEKLRGKLDVSEELEIMKNSIKEKTSQKHSLLDSLKLLFQDKSNLRAFIIINLFLIPFYFGGLAAIMIYGHVIFQAAGNSISEHVAVISIAATQLIASLIMSLLVDRVGRKPLVLFSGVCGGICNFVIGFYFFTKDYMDINVVSYNTVPLLAAIVLVFSFNIGIASIQPVIVGEILSTEIKAIGSCLTSLIGGFQAIVSLKMYLILTDGLHLGHSIPFFGFAIALLVTTIVLYCITPETKGKTFAEIQKMLGKKM